MARNSHEIKPRVPQPKPAPETEAERLARLERNLRRLPVFDQEYDDCQCTCSGCKGNGGFVDHCGFGRCLNGRG